MTSQAKANKRYYNHNKEKIKERSREYYQRNKEKQKEQTRLRNIQKKEGAYKWFYKVVTAYLPYEQGKK